MRKRVHSIATQKMQALACASGLYWYVQQVRSLLPLRVLLYAVLYWEREWKNWEAQPAPRDGFRLTPIVPIVFHTGEQPWNSSRQLADLLSGPDLFKAFAPSWPVCFWDLAEKSPRELLNSSPPARGTASALSQTCV